MTVLLTGAAGFIGYHVARALLERGDHVVGIDTLNEYYDPDLKRARLQLVEAYDYFTFHNIDICDHDALCRICRDSEVTHICHLAAQAGVRYSLDHPFAYQKANNEGFLSILECARLIMPQNFVYASSSSVYGSNTTLPFRETDRTDTPVSLYAATKKSNEVTAHAYAHLYGIPCSGLRFFTVYGPWGRPDMALFIFTKAILEGRAIDVYNEGRMRRNFTYIDDIVQGILLVMDHPKQHEIYNIGNNRAEELLDFIHAIEKHLGVKACMHMMPMQPGDVPATEADVRKIMELGYAPRTNIDQGVRAFVDWYRSYYDR